MLCPDCSWDHAQPGTWPGGAAFIAQLTLQGLAPAAGLMEAMGLTGNTQVAANPVIIVLGLLQWR